MAATSNGTKTSFGNTPQAKDDAFTNVGATEDSSGIFIFNVMANDAGGNAKSLYSVDAGGTPDRLLAKDTARSAAESGDLSKLGAKVWITADGNIGYQLTETARQQLQQLAAGETLTDSFSYAIQLGNGTLSWATASFTVAGTNDAPVVVLADLTGGVTEAVAPAGMLADSGTISFSDADLSDMHAVSSVAVGASLGVLTVAKDSDTTGTGIGGQLTWSYSVDAAAVEYLANGETKVESFIITVDDQHGGFVSRQVDVTVTGTNDGPVITAEDLSGAVTELVTPAGALGDNGTISFNDVDLADVHVASVAAAGATLGTLNVAKTADTTGTGVGGELAWNYEVSAEAIEYLAQGETRVESFTITLDDQNGGTVARQIDVTLTGTNDAAVISGESSGEVREDENVSGGLLSAAGNLVVTDADANQSSFVAQSDVAGSGGFGTFTLDASGAWTYKVDNSLAAVQDLDADESLVDTFTAVSLDGSSSEVVSVTIHGADDHTLALKGFESGNFSGWNVLGSAAVVQQHGTYQPTEGDYLGALFGAGASAGQIESFLGLNQGKLSAMGNGTATNGSALKTTLNVKAGDVVHFDWAFIATDYLPFNDFSVAVTGNGQVLELADIQGVGNYGTTGWKSFDYTATADMVLTVGVAVSNVLDSGLSPQLLIDNLTIL